MFVYKENYWREFSMASIKLFLESYFDIVMCVMLNFVAFIKMEDEWSSFFATKTDAMCSTLTIIFSSLIFFFPVLAHYWIRKNQDRLGQEQDEFLSILLEGVDPHNYHASMYTVYFLTRRLITGVILITLVEW